MVMHDANLRRLAGRNLNVKDLTQEELTKITVRAGEMEAKIPSLEEWIQLSIQLNLPQLLEAKRATSRVRVELPQSGRWAADMYAESVTVLEVVA